jgi:FlaG/FlaF family flagellin (archaellin)
VESASFTVFEPLSAAVLISYHPNMEFQFIRHIRNIENTSLLKRKKEKKEPIVGTYKKARKMRQRRGVGPVIPTVILVTIAIIVAIAVSYWMGGTTSQFTHFEQLEVQNADCLLREGNWTITLKLKNTGTKEATLASLFINAEEVDRYGQADSGYIFTNEWATNMTQHEVVQNGANVCVLVYMDPDRVGSSLSSKTMINVKVHTSSGTDYLKMIELP